MTSIRSFVKQLFGKKKFITVVSGLPRSGTSMMMSALRAGGMDLCVDGFRNADANNPKGYYEYERVKKLPKDDTSWLGAAQGKVVKIISPLLEYLPKKYQYRVIFMERDIGEILASQARMLERAGKEEDHLISDRAMRQSYRNHLAEVKAWLMDKDWIQVIYVSYNDVLYCPQDALRPAAAFLNHIVDPQKMASVVDQALYREKM